MLFNGEDFILQVQRVFTCICSGALLGQAAAARVDLPPRAQWQCARVADSGQDLFQMATNVEDGKP
jgi:hypothetical protein